VNIECGTGEQIMRWLAFTACSRLSYLRGELPHTAHSSPQRESEKGPTPKVGI